MSEKDEDTVEQDIQNLAAQFGVPPEAQQPVWADRIISEVTQKQQPRQRWISVTVGLVGVAAVTTIAMFLMPHGNINRPVASPTSPPSAAQPSEQTQDPDAAPLSNGTLRAMVAQAESIVVGQLFSVTSDEFAMVTEQAVLGMSEDNSTLRLASDCLMDATELAQGPAIAFVTSAGKGWLYVRRDTEFSSACSTPSSGVTQFTQAELDTALAGMRN